MGASLTPPYDVLLSMSHTHTVDMVADQYGVTERTAYYWFQKNGLRPLPRPRGRKKKISLDFEYIKQCIQYGLSLEEISGMLHVCKQTISTRLKEEGTTFKEIQNGGKLEAGSGHVCKPKGAHDCKYWNVGVGCCDYLCMVGHSRPCPPNACTVYEKGQRLRTYEKDGFNDRIF